MAAKTPKKLILDALKDLGRSELEEFCSVLLDLREEPRIYKCDIEDKSRTQITDQLVRTFTEDGAMEVTLKIMKEIDCNNIVKDLEEAVNLKNQMESDLKSQQDTLNKHIEFHQTYSTVIEHNKKQVETTEKQISAEIEKLHQFLRDEEKARLEALREEGKKKAETVNREMENIARKISSLSVNNISAVEQELQRSIGHRVQCPVSQPQLVSGDVMIDVSKHLGNLTYRVWEKMKEKVEFTSVILDPNTANAWLCLSEDLTSVRRSDTKQQLPNNPARFTRYASVLGSEGFCSGKHSWEVEVGDHPDWVIGLVRESVDRKGNMGVTPEHGVMCLDMTDGQYSNGYDDKPISVQRKPRRIRVQLDYSEGEVSFYDPEDMTHIYTHKHTLTEKLYPYINIGESTIDIKVCQVETSVSVMLQ